MGKALAQPMVLVMSLWDDHYANMLWLDSTYPTDGSKAGSKRGSCATTSGVPSDIEANAGNSNVICSNIRFGPINSTFLHRRLLQPRKPRHAEPSSSASSGPTGGTGTGAAHWAQCGGQGWTGPTTCVSPYKCTYSNPYYSQCL